jgi:hypothetical protein
MMGSAWVLPPLAAQTPKARFYSDGDSIVEVDEQD